MTYDPRRPLTDPVIAKCAQCQWNLPFDSETAADAALNRHLPRCPKKPAQPAVETPPVQWEAPTQLVSVTWWSRAIDRIAEQPAGSRFTLYEICADLDEPPSSNGWQSLARDAHHIGLIEPKGGVPSKRPGTRRSMTTLWQRTALNPTRQRRTG